jgi:hypothetical protein
MRSRFTGLTAIITVTCLALVAVAPEAYGTVRLGINDAGRMTPAGSFVVSVWEGGAWREAALLPADRFLRETAADLGGSLPPGAARVRIGLRGGGAAHLDQVSLGGTSPVMADGAETALLARADLDLVEMTGRELELTFPPDRANATLLLTGRIETAKISPTPFHYPPGEAAVDRGLAYSIERGRREPGRPLFTETSLPVSGHPAGPVSGWAWEEGGRLRARLDFTTDNTMDGDLDWASLRVATPGGPREFRVTASDRRWGRALFVPTEAAPYRHKVYEFEIPVEEAGLDREASGRPIELAFSAYGTSSPGTYRGSLVYDLVRNRYLQVYQEFMASPASQVWVRLLGPDGAPTGAPRMIFEANIPFPAAAAFDPVNGRYLVAWTQFRGLPGSETDIRGMFIDADGAPMGAPFTIADQGAAWYRPLVVFDPFKLRYMVSWSDYRNQPDTDSDIYGQIVTWNGGLVSPSKVNIPLVRGVKGENLRDCVFDSVHDRFLLLWRVYQDEVTKADIHGQIFTAGWKPWSQELIISNVHGYQDQPAGAFDPVSRRFLVVWQDGRDPAGDDIYCQVLDDHGRLLETASTEGLPICTATGAQTSPSVTFGTRLHRFLVTWTDGRDPLDLDIYGMTYHSELGAWPTFAVVVGGVHESFPETAYNSFCSNFLVSFNAQAGTVYDIGLHPVGGVCPGPFSAVTVIDPSVAETVPGGSVQPIHWGAPAAAESFRVRYSLDGGLTWARIPGLRKGVGLLWKAPMVRKNLPLGLVKVIALDGSGAVLGSDVSDQNFTTEALLVTSPPAGATMTRGVGAFIAWRSGRMKPAAARTVVSYRTAPGNPWIPVASLPGDPGFYYWSVPADAATGDAVALRVVIKGPAPLQRLGSVIAEGYRIVP